jgi:hypothetical protein
MMKAKPIVNERVYHSVVDKILTKNTPPTPLPQIGD